MGQSLQLKMKLLSRSSPKVELRQSFSLFTMVNSKTELEKSRLIIHSREICSVNMTREEKMVNLLNRWLVTMLEANLISIKASYGVSNVIRALA
jgi:hypothetical protein